MGNGYDVIILIIISVSMITIPAFAPSHPEYVGVAAPLKQIKAGVALQDVICNEGKVPASKYDSKSVACVSLETAKKLEMRGWGVMTLQPKTESPKPQPNAQLQNHSINCYGKSRCFVGFVTQVIDGDTIMVDGKSIRFALSSTPELNEFGGIETKKFVEKTCPIGSVATVDEDDGQTEGSYGRIIGVIYCNGVNLNEAVLEQGLGTLSSGFCSVSEFSGEAWAKKFGCATSHQEVKTQKTTPTSQPSAPSCDPSYPDFCIPPPPPDLDCGDIPQKRFTVLQPDPHRFDGDKDGIGCES